MSVIKTVQYTDNKAALAAPGKYVEVSIDVSLVLESWRASVFSFEWLDDTGAVKPVKALKEKDQMRYNEVAAAFEAGQQLEKPVLGIGLQEHAEIGSGKAVLLTLAALGVEAMPVHIPASNVEDFESYIAKG